MEAKYLKPFTDFSVKKLFGKEAIKSLLRDFLNALLPLESPVTELRFRTAEQLGEGVDVCEAVFDIYDYTAQGSAISVNCKE